MSAESSIDYDECLRVAVDAAQAAGRLMLDAWEKPKQIDSKINQTDLVTATDKASEALIFGMLRGAFADHEFLGEESHSDGADGAAYNITDKPIWIVDPVDGTSNFVHGLPQTCVSIGLLVNKRPVVGVVHCPVLRETFTAVVGKGAHCNGQPIAVSTAASVKEAAVGTEYGYDRSAEGVDRMVEMMRRLLTAQVQTVRSFGSCAINMCYVASGRLDCYYEGKDGEMGPKPWDMAAGWLVVTEAGGVALEMKDGSEIDICSGRVLVANGAAVADGVIALLQA